MRHGALLGYRRILEHGLLHEHVIPEQKHAVQRQVLAIGCRKARVYPEALNLLCQIGGGNLLLSRLS